jgi:hypothetical protein
VAVSPGGTRLFVTGYSAARPGGWDYATFAYSAATGKRLWASRYNGPANRDDVGYSVAVSPAGTAVYVTGGSLRRAASGYADDYATVAYGAATGSQLWVSRYNGPANDDSTACCVAVSPRRATVFVTGSSNDVTTRSDYATVAYRG